MSDVSGHGMRVPEWATMCAAEKNARLEEARPFVGTMSWHALSYHSRTPVDALRRYFDPAWHKERLRQSRAYRRRHFSPIGAEYVTAGSRVALCDVTARLAEIPQEDTRSLTGILFGDPIPGRSALDRASVSGRGE